MARSTESVEREIVESLMRKGVANYIAPGSVFRELASSIGNQISVLERRQDSILNQSRITDATGEALDRIGRDLFTPRIEARRASSFATDRNVRLHTRNGASFASNGLTELPGGFTISNGSNVEYELQITPQAISELSEVWLSVSAKMPGASSNVGARTLNSHNMTEFQRNIIVSNRYPISNGVSRESDSNYRERLLRARVAGAGADPLSIEARVARTGMVGRYTILENYRGLGTSLVVVQPTVGILFPEAQLAYISSLVSGSVSPGRRVEVQNPKLVQFHFETTVQTNRALTSSQKEVLRGRIVSQVINYLNTMGIGVSLDISRIQSIIRSADASIVKTSKGSAPLDYVRLTVGEGAERWESDVTGRSFLDVDPDELIVLDVSSPISIKII